MSLYALTSQAIQGLKRNFWGTKIPTEYESRPDGSIAAVEGGANTDTGVQAAVTELVSRLSSTDPIQLGGPLQLVQKAGVAAISLTQHNLGANTTAIELVDAHGNVSTLGFDGMVNTNGITGSFTVMTNATISVVGCTVTVNGTFVNLDFQNGLLVGVK